MLRRRSRAAFLGAGVLALSLLGTATGSAVVEPFEWAGPGKSAERTAFNWRSGLTPTNVATLHRSWGVGGGVFTPPIIADGIIVAGDNGGTGRTRLRALDADTGAVVWTKAYGSSTTAKVSAPSTSGSLVFVTVERATILGWIYDLYAYDLHDGDLVWDAEIGVANRGTGPRDVLFTSGRVITPTASGNGFKRLAVYQASTGYWRYSVTPGGNISAFAANSAVAYVATKTAIEVYDLDTGSNVNTILGGAGSTSIIVSASGIYATPPNRVVNYDSTGFVTFNRQLTAGCNARMRVLTPKMVGYSQDCGTAAKPEFLQRGTPAPAMLPGGVANGDRPVAAAQQFIVAVTGNRALKFWDTRAPRLGQTLTTPTLASGANITTTGGPIVAAGKLIVPEVAGLEVFIV